MLGPGYLGLHRPRLALRQPLPGLRLGLQCMEQDGRFIHGNNFVQYHHRTAANHHQKILACSHPLLLNVVHHEFWDSPHRLLCQVQVMSEGEIDLSLRNPIGPSEFL